MAPPDIEEALRALDEELGMVAKVRLGGDPESRAAKAPYVRWERVAEWCREHPGLPFTADGVHKNAIWRFRRNYPDILVQGSNHRLHPETGKQIATLWACFKPEEGLAYPGPPRADA
jgi:hypothetical protein